MKKNYLKKTVVSTKVKNLALSFVALFFLVNVQAQCPSGNVTLNTQAQVNQFSIDHPNCTVINGNLTISGADIVNLNGLNNLVQVTGYLGVYTNNLLQSFAGLENLTTLGASLDVSNNPGLLNANGLSGLTNIGTEIQFFNNAQLQNISSLTGVTGTGGGIWIIQNPQLQSLNGLQNILQIGSDIEVRGNTVLNNITALQNINPSSITPTGGYGLTIQNNPAVSVCSLPNLCTYLANPANTHPREISGNLANCLNEAAVVAACATLSVNDVDMETLSCYPNPVKDVLNLSYDKEIENVSVINLLGQTILTKTIYTQHAQIDLDSIPAGNYFVKITSEGAVKMINVIKQ